MIFPNALQVIHKIYNNKPYRYTSEYEVNQNTKKIFHIINIYLLFSKFAAKLPHQTAKTCQYTEKNALFFAEKCVFCLVDSAKSAYSLEAKKMQCPNTIRD